MTGVARYTPATFDRVRLEEFCAHEARDVAHATLLRHAGNRLGALVWMAFRWSDETLKDPCEEMVREMAIELLLADANPVEADAYEATKAFHVTTYEAALACIAMTLTHAPLAAREVA